MAIPAAPPQVTPVPGDLVTLKEGIALTRDTPHPINSLSTMNRLLDRHSVRRWRRGRADYVSFSDLLEAQRDDAASRAAP